MTRAWIVLLVAGCIEPVAPDVSTEVAELATPWSTPVRLAAVSSVGHEDTDPAISADGLELYFVSIRGGTRRIYMSTRFSRDSLWGAAVPVSALWGVAGTSDSGPELSHDGLSVWFTRTVVNQPGARLYVATRAIRSLGWSSPTPVEELDDMQVHSPHVSQDGLTLYFTNGDPTVRDIYTATRASTTDPWHPRPVNRWTSAASDDAPTTARSEREAYFDSTRGGALRVYRSTRTVDTPWTIPAIVEELAGASRTDVAPDARSMVMTITPNNGDPDIYEAHR